MRMIRLFDNVAGTDPDITVFFAEGRPAKPRDPQPSQPINHEHQ